MNKRFLVTTFLALALLIPSISGAQRGRSDQDKSSDSKKGAWIHIEVVEANEGGANVKVNLPLSMARIALDMAPEEIFEEGRIQIDDVDITIEDLRDAWSELRDAGDGEFVTVRDGRETVKIYRENSTLFVDCDGDHGELVRIEVPVTVVDALLSGRSDELDVDAALAALENMDEGTLVRVQDGDDTVRIWID